ncbi:hypothetical protein [Streptosporangium amethystogenes]|uniref:hypothetical protein n=1 Tax=Streptosporangium amethystogenes TaxID=2002 RepID=UPI0012FCB880|nr:hypothetical protein [Streptosporangium amethystogenes]
MAEARWVSWSRRGHRIRGKCPWATGTASPSTAAARATTRISTLYGVILLN